MGIYSRDYVREPTGRQHGFGSDTPACKWLIIITCVVFLLQLIFVPRAPIPLPEEIGVFFSQSATSYIDQWFSLSFDHLRSFQIWRLVTYAFLHDRFSLWHLLFNMLGLWWFGTEMERLYGSKEFTWFYLASAAAAGFGYVVWQLLTGMTMIPVIGASGAVLATLTLFAMHYPHHKIGLFYGLLFIEARWVVVIFAIVDLIPVLQSLQGQGIHSGVAHAAHLLGILFGWMYRHYHWHLSSWVDWSAIQRFPRRFRQSRAKKNLRVYAPETEVKPEPEANLEAELDRILAKIHEQGSDSLTAKEQAILTKASQQYKNRQ